MQQINIFDLDNTLFYKLQIDYNKMRDEFKKVTNMNCKFRPIIKDILSFDNNKELFDIIDKYELYSILTSKKRDVLYHYNNSIINNKENTYLITRNGYKLVKQLFKKYNIILPFEKNIFTRETNINKQKTDIDFIDEFYFSKDNCINYFGDSIHDVILSINLYNKFKCDILFYPPFWVNKDFKYGWISSKFNSMKKNYTNTTNYINSQFNIQKNMETDIGHSVVFNEQLIFIKSMNDNKII